MGGGLVETRLGVSLRFVPEHRPTGVMVTKKKKTQRLDISERSAGEGRQVLRPEDQTRVQALAVRSLALLWLPQKPQMLVPDDLRPVPL